jgi:CubicO group peptidase (beta-lactamase class C family)
VGVGQGCPNPQGILRAWSWGAAMCFKIGGLRILSARGPARRGSPVNSPSPFTERVVAAASVKRHMNPNAAMRVILTVLLGLGASGCLPRAALPIPAAERLRVARPAEAGFSAALSRRLDSLGRSATVDGTAPAVAIAVGRHGRLVHLGAYGRIDRPANAPAASDSTLFDLASLTKVVATTTAAMILEDDSLLDLDRTVASYLPELSDSAKAGITVRMLLNHTGGLEAFAPLFREFRGREQYLEQINRRPLRAAPGTTVVYSDWDLILLQLVIERITGEPLDVLVDRRVFRPLGMRHTGYRPPASLRARIAATEVDSARGGLIWGEVHDPNAWAMGGVAGHAGLFGTAGDLAIFAQMLLNGGEYGGARLIRPQTVARWTAPQRRGSSRALGWDTPSGQSSAGRYFSARSFGHTGYTGTSLWIDPERSLFVVLLTNRVNPTADNQRHVALRRAVADAVMQAVRDARLLDWEARRAPPPAR